MNDALFIDASNLNTMFMVDGRFCLGANYSSCPERLMMDVQAIGSSYDVYVSLWPRQPKEGDVVISGLTVGDVEFWALKDEVRTIHDAVRNLMGVNNIYICNALACFLEFSRVENFQTVLRCGQRFALVDVQGRVPMSMSVFSGQRELYEEMGDEFTCYGDVDLVDADNIRAQYPELAKLMRTTIVPLTQIIAARDTDYKLSIEDVNNQIARYVPEEEREPEPEPDFEEEPVEDVEEVEEVEERRPRQKIDWLSAAMVALICLCCLAVGYGYQFRDADSTAQTYMANLGSYEDQIAYQQSIKAIYDDSVGLGNTFADIMAYAKSSELEVSVSTASCFTDRVVLQFNCNAPEIKDQFVYYLERKYSIANTNQYGSVNNTDGSITYEYGITLLL